MDHGIFQQRHIVYPQLKVKTSLTIPGCWFHLVAGSGRVQIHSQGQHLTPATEPLRGRESELICGPNNKWIGFNDLHMISAKRHPDISWNISQLWFLYIIPGRYETLTNEVDEDPLNLCSQHRQCFSWNSLGQASSKMIKFGNGFRYFPIFSLKIHKLNFQSTTLGMILLTAHGLEDMAAKKA